MKKMIAIMLMASMTPVQAGGSVENLAAEAPTAATNPAGAGRWFKGAGRLASALKTLEWGSLAWKEWQHTRLLRLEYHLGEALRRAEEYDAAYHHTQQHQRKVLRRQQDPQARQRSQAIIDDFSHKRERLAEFRVELEQQYRLIPYWRSLLDANRLTHAMEQEITDTELLLESSPLRQPPDTLLRSPEALWKAKRENASWQE